MSISDEGTAAEVFASGGEASLSPSGSPVPESEGVSVIIASASPATTSPLQASESSIAVTFSGDAYAVLTALSDQTGKNIGEVLREAIALERWYVDVRATGGRVLADRGGKLQELVRV